MNGNKTFGNLLKIIGLAIGLTLLVMLCVACTTEIPLDNGSKNMSSEDVSASDSSAELSNDSSIASEQQSQSPVSRDESQISTEQSSEEPSAEQSSEESSEEPSREESSEETSEPDKQVILPVEGKTIAITFDDGPSMWTDKVLEKLESLGQKATFFVVGNRLGSDNESRLRKMISLGCEIGNHSYDHTDLTTISTEKVMEQINKTNELIERYSGVKPTLLRPPYGDYTKTLAAKVGMSTIMWSVDSMDWKFRQGSKTNEEKIQEIYDYTMDQITSGKNIILFHDLYETSYGAFCVVADKLIEQGYQLVTVTELLGSEKLEDCTKFYGFTW